MRIKNILIYLATAIFIVILIGWYFLIGPSADKHGSFYNRNENAIWLRHSWVDTEAPWQQVAEMVHTLEDHGIHYAYVHTGPFEADGTVPEYRFSEAKKFLTRARAINPNIEYQAWLGQLRHKIDLDNPEVRKNIAELSKYLIEETGFDGIHIDIEGMTNEDTAFITTLQEVKAAIGERSLSVAMEEYVPRLMFAVLSMIIDVKDVVSPEFMTQVAETSDQVIIMAYDTKVKERWLYSWLLKHEVIEITRLLPDKKILIGIPSYEDDRPNFDPEVENIETALLGVTDGLNSLRSVNSALLGVAIYSNWEMDHEEWKTFKKLWVTEPLQLTESKETPKKQ